MKLSEIITRSTDFGTKHSREDFISFTLKIMFYVIPAVIIGTYTDKFNKKLYQHRIFGDSILCYIILQTIMIILTLYLFLTYLSSYISEFQVTLAGGYFIVLYFGMQSHYLHMIKIFMDNDDHLD